MVLDEMMIHDNRKFAIHAFYCRLEHLAKTARCSLLFEEYIIAVLQSILKKQETEGLFQPNILVLMQRSKCVKIERE